MNQDSKGEDSRVVGPSRPWSYEAALGPEAKTKKAKEGGAGDLLSSLSQKPPVPSSVGKGKRQSVAG